MNLSSSGRVALNTQVLKRLRKKTIEPGGVGR